MSRMKHTDDDLNQPLWVVMVICLLGLWIMAVMPWLADWLSRKG